jgi:acyl-CoA hydrolase
MTEMVLPSDANPLGTVFGGKVMQWIDIAGGIAAARHCREPVVTAGMDALGFYAPIQVGEIAVLEARVLAAFHTSVECRVTVHSENVLTGERRLCTSALLTYVALDRRGQASRVPPVVPETDEEKRLLAQAHERRLERLARLRRSPH